MEDEGELSMGMRGANNYDDDIVSDDGHIWRMNKFYIPEILIQFY